MPKILPNRSSKTLTAANVAAIQAAVQTILTNLGDLIVITDEDYKGLAKLGEVLKPICDAVLKVAKEDPSYLEEEDTIEEVEKDKTYFEQIDDIKKMLKDISFVLDREQGVCGAEYRNALGNYEVNVKTKVNKGSKAAQLTLDKLNRIDRGTKITPPPPIPPTAMPK